MTSADGWRSPLAIMASKIASRCCVTDSPAALHWAMKSSCWLRIFFMATVEYRSRLRGEQGEAVASEATHHADREIVLGGLVHAIRMGCVGGQRDPFAIVQHRQPIGYLEPDAAPVDP